jgi:hypothetical protein
VTPLGDFLAVLAFAGTVLFVILYAILAPWWRSAHGRNVMLLTSVIGLAFGLATGTILFGLEWPFRSTIRAIIYGLIAVAIWWRIALLIKDQISGRKQREGGRER